MTIGHTSFALYRPEQDSIDINKPTGTRHNPKNAHVLAVATQQPCCNTDDKQSLGLGPDIAFVTISVPIGNALADVAVQLPKASKFIMLVSCATAHMNDSLFMHFVPLGKSYNSGAIAPNGGENWFPFCNGGAGATAMTKIGLFYRFKKNLPQTLFFDIGTEAGASAYQLTFAIGNDVEEIGQLMNSTS
jgi:hypothetical protein